MTDGGLPGQTWSDNLSQTGAEGGSIADPAQAFDGRTNTYAYNGNSATNPNSMTWSIFPAFIETDYIWVLGGDGGATADGISFVVNGVSTAPTETHLQSGQSTGWFTWFKLPVNGGQFHTIIMQNAKVAGVILRGFSLDPTPYTESSQLIPDAIINGEGIGLNKILTLTDDTDLANFRKGDEVTNGGTVEAEPARLLASKNCWVG